MNEPVGGGRVGVGGGDLFHMYWHGLCNTLLGLSMVQPHTQVSYYTLLAYKLITAACSTISYGIIQWVNKKLCTFYDKQLHLTILYRRRGTHQSPHRQYLKIFLTYSGMAHNIMS